MFNFPEFAAQKNITITLPARNGEVIKFNINNDLLKQKYGITSFTRVQTPKGKARVIGEHGGNLWLLIDNDQGVSYWDRVNSKQTFENQYQVLENDIYVNPLLQQAAKKAFDKKLSHSQKNYEQKDKQTKQQLANHWSQIKGTENDYPHQKTCVQDANFKKATNIARREKEAEEKKVREAATLEVEANKDKEKNTLAKNKYITTKLATYKVEAEKIISNEANFNRDEKIMAAKTQLGVSQQVAEKIADAEQYSSIEFQLKTHLITQIKKLETLSFENLQKRVKNLIATPPPPNLTQEEKLQLTVDELRQLVIDEQPSHKAAQHQEHKISTALNTLGVNQALAKQIADATDYNNDLDQALKDHFALLQKEKEEYDNALKQYKEQLNAQELKKIDKEIEEDLIERIEKAQSKVSVYKILMPTLEHTHTGIEETPIDDLPLDQVFLTSDYKYLLSREEIIKNFEKNGVLTNPHISVNNVLTEGEIVRLCEDATIKARYEKKLNELSQKIGYVSEKTIREVINLVKGIMVKGKNRNFTPSETRRAERATKKFADYIATLGEDSDEMQYLKGYMLIRPGERGLASNAINFWTKWQELSIGDICSYECGVWLWKFVIDHEPNTSFIYDNLNNYALTWKQAAVKDNIPLDAIASDNILDRPAKYTRRYQTSQGQELSKWQRFRNSEFTLSQSLFDTGLKRSKAYQGLMDAYKTDTNTSLILVFTIINREGAHGFKKQFMRQYGVHDEAKLKNILSEHIKTAIGNDKYKKKQVNRIAIDIIDATEEGKLVHPDEMKLLSDIMNGRSDRHATIIQLAQTGIHSYLKTHSDGDLSLKQRLSDKGKHRAEIYQYILGRADMNTNVKMFALYGLMSKSIGYYLRKDIASLFVLGRDELRDMLKGEVDRILNINNKNLNDQEIQEYFKQLRTLADSNKPLNQVQQKLDTLLERLQKLDKTPQHPLDIPQQPQVPEFQ